MVHAHASPMKNGGGDQSAASDTTSTTTTTTTTGLHGHRPALQVICLGAGGGPSEENVTGLLVRSIASDWAKGSLLAVDAGSHLAPIVGILERDFPCVSGGEDGVSKDLARASLSPSPPSPGTEEPVKPGPTVLSRGPFAGLKLPNESARANALHIIRNYVSTYMITHPHLDHLSGFAINTAAFHATSRPKTLAALPSTVDAVKQHIFNDVIWPNLTDEDGGVGFVTFQRLKEGGDLMVGEGEGRGYIEVSDGLGVKAFKVSHGVCTKSPPSHHHRGSNPTISDPQPPYHSSMHGEPAPGLTRQLSMSQSGQYSAPGTPGITPRQSFYSSSQPSPRISAAADQQVSCVVDSTAFFVRDTETCREVLIFGDVEPDSISLSPRTLGVWKEAAHKIAHGLLGGIFIECSYDDSQADAFLFGHMNPKHLIAELQTLAYLVNNAKAALLQEKGAGITKKRKRSGPLDQHQQDQKRSRSLAGRIPKDIRRSSLDSDISSPPLSGIKVVIIHIKDTMKDGPHVRERILAQLRDYEDRLVAEGEGGLGCEFLGAGQGGCYWF